VLDPVATATTPEAGSTHDRPDPSPQLKKNAVTSPKIKKDAVKGADVNESTLAKVPEAANADRVGGTPVSGLLRATGCQPGKVNGHVLVLANGTVPTTFTTAGLSEVFNCSGGIVEVRRTGTGRHYVRFSGNASRLATVQVRFDVDGADEAACATARRINGGPDSGAFAVTTFDCSTDNVVNADFTLLLP
jgi:hypothetical protein